MPAKNTKANSPKQLFVKIMIVLSILGNIFFITSAIAIGVFLNSKSSDISIWSFAFSRQGINYNGPGGCLQVSKEIIKDSDTELDSKGRVISGDGKLQCIVQITPQEADAIQQKFDSENVGPPKQ